MSSHFCETLHILPFLIYGKMLRKATLNLPYFPRPSGHFLISADGNYTLAFCSQELFGENKGFWGDVRLPAAWGVRPGGTTGNSGQFFMAEGVGIEPTEDNAIAPRTALKEFKRELTHRQFPPHSGCCHHYQQQGTSLLPGVVAASTTSIAAAIPCTRASFIDIQRLPVQLLAVETGHTETSLTARSARTSCIASIMNRSPFASARHSPMKVSC